MEAILRENAKTWLCYWTRELRRLWVPILVTCLGAYWLEAWMGLYPTANWLRLAYKLNNVAIAVIFAHLTWSQVFYYLDFGTLMQSDQQVKVAGLAIMRGLFYLAVILAFSLGL